jgi:hypothetical protein
MSATNLQKYTIAQVYIGPQGGSPGLQLEAQSITVKRMSGASDVDTGAKGFAGQSPGSPKMTITVTSAVPAAGIEFDPGSYIKNLDVADIVVFAFGKTLASSGFINDDTFAYSVNSEGKLDFEVKCQMAEWV